MVKLEFQVVTRLQAMNRERMRFLVENTALCTLEGPLEGVVDEAS
jgi:hypothetical protein